ncbi:hypothetical protein CMV_028498 [Castanea mollissima]|uniref:Uncharacterized protein n=1 Tax=Castanea mollissima TaxID=60419 RepID=A0A8J4V1T9_9ROSI|nr:hypothetical protein CMV_028498 [Castanea mollissima]
MCVSVSLKFILGLIKCCRSLIQSQSLKCFVTWKGELQGVTIRQEEETTNTLALLVRLYTLLMLSSKLWSIWVTAFCLRGK